MVQGDFNFSSLPVGLGGNGEFERKFEEIREEIWEEILQNEVSLGANAIAIATRNLPPIPIAKASNLTPVRPDRDDFIRINEENMNPLMSNDFVKREHGDANYFATGSVDSGHTPYDVSSAHMFWEKYRK